MWNILPFISMLLFFNAAFLGVLTWVRYHNLCGLILTVGGFGGFIMHMFIIVRIYG